MPRYHFNLKDRTGTILDNEGTELPDEVHALRYACEVAKELMFGQAAAARAWRLEVCEDDGFAAFEVLFAMVDPSIDHLVPALRASLENTAAHNAALCEAILDLRMTLHQIKGTMARADGAPYLAALHGVRL